MERLNREMQLWKKRLISFVHKAKKEDKKTARKINDEDNQLYLDGNDYHSNGPI